MELVHNGLMQIAVDTRITQKAARHAWRLFAFGSFMFP
jgi:hypothetical protein